jgi:hypothetical protein
MASYSATNALFIALLLFPATTLAQQVNSGAGPCGAAEAGDFDFQLGVWQEVDGKSVHEVKKVLGGCAIQEDWSGGEMGPAMALKSFDKGTQSWYLSWVSNTLIHQLWEGRKESGQWRFYREWKLDGKPMLSRTFWNPAANDRLERIVEQSRDGGKTWRLHVKQIFQRKQ